MATDVPKLNLLMLGDSQVGKTSLMYRFVEEKFQMDMKQTVGMGFLTKVMDVDGVSVKVQVWDTAGQVGVFVGKEDGHIKYEQVISISQLFSLHTSHAHRYTFLCTSLHAQLHKCTLTPHIFAPLFPFLFYLPTTRPFMLFP